MRVLNWRAVLFLKPSSWTRCRSGTPSRPPPSGSVDRLALPAGERADVARFSTLAIVGGVMPG